MSLAQLKLAARIVLKTAEGALHLAFAAGVAASFWRWRPWQLLIHLVLLVIIIARQLNPMDAVTSSEAVLRTHAVLPVLLAAWVYAALRLAARYPSRKRGVIGFAMVGLLALWIATKIGVLRVLVPPLGTILGPAGLSVFGLSYIVVKLLHVLADSAGKRPPEVRASTLLGFTCFAPTFLSGPMHRYEEFASSFDSLPSAWARDWSTAIRRTTWGTFKVIVLAGHLGDWVLPVLASPAAQSPGALWLALYGYSAYIYLNFAGVSDLAIGLGAAFGVGVPENFSRPYLQLDIQSFWRTWHMTFTRWLTAYVFMPITKRLMKTSLRSRPKLVASAGYVLTFAFCGVWHGDTTNFLVWGLYHGLGLCIYTSLPPSLKPAGSSPVSLRRKAAWWLITFHFVTFGWLLFACPLPDALQALAGLVGL